MRDEGSAEAAYGHCSAICAVPAVIAIASPPHNVTRTSDQARDVSYKNVVATSVGGSDSDNETSRGNDPVICPKNGCS